MTGHYKLSIKKTLALLLTLLCFLTIGSPALAQENSATLVLENDASLGTLVQGLTASTTPPTIDNILPELQAITSTDVRILASEDDEDVSADATVGTGMRAVWGEDEVQTATFIVQGDVIGNGKLSIAQLVCMSDALTESLVLSPVQLLAVDFDGSSTISINDLVSEAQLLTNADPALTEEQRQAIIDAAVALQTSGGTYAADSFDVVLLHAGDMIYGMLPGQSAFYTDLATVEECDGSYTLMYEKLQMLPHPEFGYREQLGVYEVKADIWVATGLCLANSTIDGVYAGEGGGLQYVVPDYESALELKDTVDLHV